MTQSFALSFTHLSGLHGIVGEILPQVTAILLIITFLKQVRYNDICGYKSKLMYFHIKAVDNGFLLMFIEGKRLSFWKSKNKAKKTQKFSTIRLFFMFWVARYGLSCLIWPQQSISNSYLKNLITVDFFVLLVTFSKLYWKQPKHNIRRRDRILKFLFI